MVELTKLSDDELTDYLLKAVAREREGSAEVIRTICEIDRRKLHELRGYPTIYAYCNLFLGYSEDEAYKRMQVARAVTKFPLTLRRLEAGELSLTAARLLAPHLTPENYRRLLDNARRKSRREIEIMVAHLNPQPEKREVVRRLSEPLRLQSNREIVPIPMELRAEAAAATQGPIAIVKPVAPNRVRFAFTGTESFLAKVDRCRDLMRRDFPAGQLEDIFNEAIEALLREKDPSMKPKPTVRRRCSRWSRRIPLWLRELVWKRDGGQCSFVASDGTKCPARAYLEFDHVIPWAKGGRSDDPENVRLLCRTHNQHVAVRVFGPRPGGEAFNRPEKAGA